MTAAARPVTVTGLRRLRRRVTELRQKYMAPPPKRTVSQWADAVRIVPDYSAEPGPWRTERTPYLREIMDSFSDPEVNTVVFQKCSRVGGTEAGLNVVGYFIDQDPSPILIVQPTVDDAKDFSKEQLAPSIAETESLRRKVRSPSSRESGNTVQAKVFDGGALFLVGANSPRGFRRRTARVVVLEEVDGYPQSAGPEGDPVKLAIKRATTYAYRRKVYLNSTPTVKGLSRIADWFERSDQRRYHLPCPHCSHMAPLEWRHLKWDKDRPETVAYACPGCGATWGEEHKFPALARGQWVATHPGRPIRGFHLNALYSPWVQWRELVEEWLEAQGDILKLTVFVNHVLGEVWEDRQGGLDATALGSRARHGAGTVPLGVQVVTCGVDVQDDRLEATLWGWGAQGRRWRIAHHVLQGDPGTSEVWAMLDTVRRAPLPAEDGRTLQVFATGVDSGAHTQAVYRYCKPRGRERVYCLKGGSRPGAPLLPKKPTRNNKERVPLYLIGTDAGKDDWYSALRVLPPAEGAEPDPLYVAFDAEVTEEFLRQLTAERAVPRVMAGRRIRRYELPRGARSEALDCAVYALAALKITGLKLDEPTQGTGRGRPPTPPPADGDGPPPAPAPPPPPAPRPAPRPKRASWLHRWR